MISVWVVERGKPTITGSKPSTDTLHHLVPLKFSSTLIEIEIADSGAKNRKSTMFFSFAHGSNQIIGHRDFINMD